MVGNFEAAVDCCIEEGKIAEALVLAAYGGPNLWNKTQEIFLKKTTDSFMRVIFYFHF